MVIAENRQKYTTNQKDKPFALSVLEGSIGKAIVEALCLQDYVDVVSSKPFMYIDDLQANDILGERLYLGKDSKYGTTNLKETK